MLHLSAPTLQSPFYTLMFVIAIALSFDVVCAVLFDEGSYQQIFETRLHCWAILSGALGSSSHIDTSSALSQQISSSSASLVDYPLSIV